MRIFKFIGVFLGTLLVVFLIVFGFNPDALYTLYENSEDLQEGQEWVSKTTSLKGLTEYIGQQPQHAAVVSRSVTNPDTTIYYSSDQPHTMGTLSNFFLITTYARLVENDEINPDELVPLDKVDQYQLPYIDASNHDDAQTALNNWEAITSDNKTSLNDLVQSAIIYNDLAASDYLFNKVGQEAISKTYQLLDLEHTERPLPFAGLYITLHPVLQDMKFESHFEQLKNFSKDKFRDLVITNTDRYVNDQTFHDQVETLFDEHQGLGIGFVERRDILTLFPKSTAGELSRLMVQLEQDSLISSSISKKVKDLMDWPYDEQGLNNDFKYYGAIYDNRLGLLNGIDYGASVYSEEPFGQAVFFDSLQVAFWFHMSSNLMHQDYQQRLMWDPALRTTTLQEIGK
jgi:hypothetical protein